jgi:RNA polymerase sigma-70 factor (ECF subfamily)
MSETHDFESFMNTHQDMVYTTAVRLLGNESEAEDVAQEVFLKAYERFDELSQSPTVGGWLRTVARNLSLNHLSRYRARWRFFSEMSNEDDDRDFGAELPAPDTQTREIGETDRWKFLEDALQKLPPAQRIPLVLYHFEEMRYEDISERLGISLSKVKTDIHRGRESLFKRLKTLMTGDPWDPANSGANLNLLGGSSRQSQLSM